MEALYSVGMANNISRTLQAAVPLMNQLTPPQSKYRGHQPPQKWSAGSWRSRISWWNGGNRLGVSEVSTERQIQVRSYCLRCEHYLLDMPQPWSLSSLAEGSKLKT
jgi:hypothetical protein